MTPILTAEQIGELEALLAKATPEPWGEITEADGPYTPQELANACAVRAVRNAAPALIAMAKQVITHDSPAWDANERLNDTVEELIERAEKAETEVATLLARLQSTESALDRAMARSNSWREEASRLQAQMLADQGRGDTEAERLRGALSDLDRIIFNDPQVIERAGQFREHLRAVLALGDQSPAETPGTCETCLHQEVIKQARTRRHPCWTCVPGISKYPGWTPKPIPSTIDKGEGL